MKRFRYNTINSLPHSMKIEEHSFKLHQKFTESLSDVSYFVPTSESVRNLKVGDTVPNQYYDFSDGIDNGFVLPKARDRRSDISEISTEIDYKVGVIKDGLHDFEKIQNFSKSLEQHLNSDVKSDSNSKSN